jgi:hypothetical protein
MAVRFLIITISMLSFSESLPLDSPLPDLNQDRNLELDLFWNLLGDLDLELDGLVFLLRSDSLVEFFLVEDLTQR